MEAIKDIIREANYGCGDPMDICNIILEHYEKGDRIDNECLSLFINFLCDWCVVRNFNYETKWIMTLNKIREYLAIEPDDIELLFEKMLCFKEDIEPNNINFLDLLAILNRFDKKNSIDTPANNVAGYLCVIFF